MPRTSFTRPKKSSSSSTSTKPRGGLSKKKRGNSSSVAAAATGLHIEKELTSVDRFFYAYANESSGVIDPEGIEKLCSDIEIDPTDVRILMLAWMMRCKKQGYITLEEWNRYFNRLRVDSVDKLKKALPAVEKEVKESHDFVDFYSYAFQYCLIDDRQKVVEIDTICQLLDLLFKNSDPVIPRLIAFLKEQTDYKALNLDQWMGFFRFFKEVRYPNLEKYYLDQAWPSVVDNFVAWLTAN